MITELSLRVASPVTWPVVVRPARDGAPPIELTALSRSDRRDWYTMRAANRDYLARWDPTPPQGSPPPLTFPRYVANLRREARAGRLLPFAIRHEGELVGQVHLFGICRASELSGAAGYWVAQAVSGRGIATWSLAMLIDHAFASCAAGGAGLHRVEVNVRPENEASLAVVRKLGLREEGLRRRFLHIDGAWRDHLSFAVTREDLDGALIQDRVSRPSMKR